MSRGAVLLFPNRKRYAEFSYKIQDFRQDLKISGFQSRIAAGFQDFNTDFRIYARFQDFSSDLRGMSGKVYEISRSGGPLATVIAFW